MAILRQFDSGGDILESQCSGCDMFFNLCWQVNPFYDQPEYCPFCGEEIESIEFEDELEEE